LSKVFLVRLHVIQFTRYSVRCFVFARSFLILSHSNSFVKNFFQVFANLFEAIRSLVVLANNFAMLAHPFEFVKHFFQVFANFFRIRYSFGAARRRLAYTSTPVPFCQALFSKFSIFSLLIPFVFRMQAFVSPGLIFQSFPENSPVSWYRNQISYPHASNSI